MQTRINDRLWLFVTIGALITLAGVIWSQILGTSNPLNAAISNTLLAVGPTLIASAAIFHFVERAISQHSAEAISTEVQRILLSNDFIGGYYSAKDIQRIGLATFRRLFNDAGTGQSHWDAMESLARNPLPPRHHYYERLDLIRDPTKPYLLRVKGHVHYETLLKGRDCLLITADFSTDQDHVREVLTSQSEFPWNVLLCPGEEPDLSHFVLKSVRIDKKPRSFERLSPPEGTPLEEIHYKVPLTNAETAVDQPTHIDFEFETVQASNYGFISIGFGRLTTRPRLLLNYTQTDISSIYVLPYVTARNRPTSNPMVEAREIEVYSNDDYLAGSGIVFTWSEPRA